MSYLREIPRRLKSEGLPDLTVRQVAVLDILAEESDPCVRTVRSLAKALGVGKPIITRVVNRLTERGYAVRTPDTGDKRSLTINVTEQGRIAHAAYLRIHTCT